MLWRIASKGEPLLPQPSSLDRTKPKGPATCFPRARPFPFTEEALSSTGLSARGFNAERTSGEPQPKRSVESPVEPPRAKRTPPHFLHLDRCRWAKNAGRCLGPCPGGTFTDTQRLLQGIPALPIALDGTVPLTYHPQTLAILNDPATAAQRTPRQYETSNGGCFSRA